MFVLNISAVVFGFVFFNEWKEVEIGNCAVDFCLPFINYFKPVSSDEDFILITSEL